nr:hypothetical protein [uncultured Albidiferax sp.]
MFLLKSDSAKNILKVLSKNIAIDEILRFHNEPFFEYEHVILCDDLLLPLKHLEMPTSNFYDYTFALSEMPFLERGERYSKWLEIYCCCLYVYCDSKESVSYINDCNFYHLVANVINDDLKVLKIDDFIEEVYETAEWDFNGQDYIYLLTWLLIERVFENATQFIFDRVKYELLNRRCDARFLDGIFINSKQKWYDLHKNIPLNYGVKNEEFMRMIFGFGED